MARSALRAVTALGSDQICSATRSSSDNLNVSFESSVVGLYCYLRYKYTYFACLPVKSCVLYAVTPKKFKFWRSFYSSVTNWNGMRTNDISFDRSDFSAQFDTTSSIVRPFCDKWQPLFKMAAFRPFCVKKTMKRTADFGNLFFWYLHKCPQHVCEVSALH